MNEEIQHHLTQMVRYQKGEKSLRESINYKTNRRQKAIWNEDEDAQHELEGELVELNASLQNTKACIRMARDSALAALNIDPHELEPLIEPA